MQDDGWPVSQFYTYAYRLKNKRGEAGRVAGGGTRWSCYIRMSTPGGSMVGQELGREAGMGGVIAERAADGE